MAVTNAALEMVGSRTWFAGRATCLPYLAGVVGVHGDWRMVAIAANGQPAAAAYRRDEDGVLRAFGIATLDVTASGIARIVGFWPGLVLAPLALTRLVIPILTRLVSGAVGDRAAEAREREAREKALRVARERAALT